MARRIIISVVVTLALLGLARRLSVGRPADIVVEEGGLKILHRTVTEQVGPGEPVLVLRVDPPQGVAASVVYGSEPAGDFRELRFEETSAGLFEARLPDLGKGARVRYAITVRRQVGAPIRVPDRPDRSVLLKYKGHASTPVLAAHIATMFGSFFFMVMSLLGAVRILRGVGDKAGAVRPARWVLVLSFVGGWPLGFLLNYQSFGTLWGGYPFGSDLTDNKTQAMFLLWLVSLLLAWGSFLGKGESADRLSARAFAWAVVMCFTVSLALFVIPHSM